MYWLVVVVMEEVRRLSVEMLAMELSLCYSDVSMPTVIRMHNALLLRGESG
jgi:hypothetical protein